MVAMSGGVDSSVAACLLHEQGYQVIGFFMRTGVESPSPAAGQERHRGCCSATDAADARWVAGRLGVSFYALNFENEFDTLIDYFVEEYKNGRTPNPCVHCNNRLKFGRIVDYAHTVDANLIATGHYARIGQRAGQPILRRAVDRTKDQSYVLNGLDRSILQRLIFPLGELTKEQVRAEARRFDLPMHDKPDSVEICFVPDRNYARVVRERAPEAFRQGAVVDQQGREVGRHDGIANFTIGQRRGLGIALGLPIYVTHLDSENNRVTVGEKAALYHRALQAVRVNWLIDPPATPWRANVQIRYQHSAAPATIYSAEPGQMQAIFDEPQMAITPGQAVAVYDDDDCLGGGWIRLAQQPAATAESTITPATP
ncbi:MAG: tRNA-specific 2-thiouridylase MnmA [Phycisphaerae bacterium]|nr:tRNA-specific 2-thiouridylase MnmA [Phycisphaerae bacterium]